MCEILPCSALFTVPVTRISFRQDKLTVNYSELLPLERFLALISNCGLGTTFLKEICICVCVCVCNYINFKKKDEIDYFRCNYVPISIVHR